MSSLLFGNGTDIVRWRPNPQTRGTFDILSTCMITMVLCVWTAVHLNVPIPGTVWGPRVRKVGWLVLALLAPEMVAYTAWYQRQEALDIARVVNEAYGLPKPLSRYQEIATAIKKTLITVKRVITRKQEPTRQPTLEAQKPAQSEHRDTWTMVHGFYAVMGGIAFEISESEAEKFLPSKIKEIWFIGGEGIRKLTELESGREIIPNISEEEIKSKSKANGLAKALVCIQALWFIAQCLTRLAQRIPISLLELNTFGHAVCALLIYLLWWEKPFEVDYPTMTEGQILFDCRAFDQMGYQSTQIVKRYKDAFRDQPNSDQFEEFLKKVVIYWLLLQNQSILRLIFRHESQSESPSVALRNTLLNQKLKEIPQSIWNELSLIDYQRRAPEEYDSGQASSNYEAQSEQGTRHDEDNEMTPTLLGPGDFLQGTGFQLKSELKDWEGSTYSEMVGVNPLPRFPTIELTSSDVTRWKMASCFIEESERAHHNANAFSTNMMHRRCKDWPDVDLIFELPIALGFGVAALIYGGLHALAWSAHFDSLTEQLLWRMSACVVMGGVPICYIITSLGVYYQDHFAISMGEKYWFRAMEKVFNVSIYLWLALIYLILLAYILARAYLVVESFINLSDLPAGAYDLPRWSTYFPHFS